MGQPAALEGEEAAHAFFSRRVRLGETVAAQGPDGHRYECLVTAAQKNLVKISPIRKLASPKEQEALTVLYQAVVATPTLDQVLQKATELGIGKVCWFNSERAPAFMSREKFAQKLPRWQKILWESAKQCERVKPPILEFYSDAGSAASSCQNLDLVIVFDASGKPVQEIRIGSGSVAVVVGPEGGFTAGDLQHFSVTRRCCKASLGHLSLRAETAAVAGLAAISVLRQS